MVYIQNSKEEIDHNIDSPDKINANILEIIEYAYKTKRDIDITICQPEFTSLCPMTGLPDFGSVIIKYCPDQMIVELKSLKIYLLQYRNVGIFYEHIVNKILDDIVGVLSPKWMEITGEFTARGGITTSTKAVYNQKN